MIEVLTDAYMTHKDFLELWSEEKIVIHILMTSLVCFFLEHHEAWVGEVDGTIQGVALYVPPGRDFMRKGDHEIVFGPALSMIGKRRQTFIDRELMPTTSARVESRFPGGAREWCYLAMFGVDPMWQGKGLGSRIIQHKNKQLKGTPMCVSTQSSRTVNFFLSNGFDVRIEHKFELAWGPTWFEWFMTNPGSAETRAAPAPASVSPIQPKKQLPAARPQAKGCNGAKVNAAVAAVSPSRIHAAGAVH
ncbi:hypothetical protein A1Q1_07173 [Trichosporon asahii var. asahii CBS 2479]|uniref:N-acetyltransferase domain-containing protein n=1 Tax=Trichosporon asahii var. asahii (strain ATCC 90039 / CBS 2479 / JCM 2466 / KCTC 7840 / NBRC 103889/ NCYC 2677 / UAMH 7654) TaxID=1186058 RepID=J4UIR3_TRIAS|nr:hypothetical protein A1Q1_07173 [Trichosporon asahii var. asahii CBS 2479]EJT51585.1 hypothetical protein A1Q1_07173 [Trichosporon asahii var. asahii CBS 2479]